MNLPPRALPPRGAGTTLPQPYKERLWNWHHLLKILGKACGLELTLDEGRCTLRFDGEHDVTIERDGNAVILHGIAGDGGCLSNPDEISASCSLPAFLGAETGRRPRSPQGRGTHRGNRALEAARRLHGLSGLRSRHQCVPCPAHPLESAHRRPAVRGGVRFGHIHPRRDHGLRQYWGREGKRFWRLPTFFLPCKNFSVFQHRLTRSGRAPQGQSLRAPGRARKALSSSRRSFRIGFSASVACPSWRYLPSP